MESKIVEVLQNIEKLLESIKDNTEKTASVADYNYHELTDIKKEITGIKEFLDNRM